AVTAFPSLYNKSFISLRPPPIMSTDSPMTSLKPFLQRVIPRSPRRPRDITNPAPSAAQIQVGVRPASLRTAPRGGRRPMQDQTSVARSLDRRAFWQETPTVPLPNQHRRPRRKSSPHSKG